MSEDLFADGDGVRVISFCFCDGVGADCDSG
jgi:hypothetical protein